MKRYVLPLVGLLAALWATVSIARTQPRRATTEPPAQPPVSDFANTVAAVGLVETSTENISIGSPLPAVVARVLVTAGQTVKAGQPLFELDVRQLRAERAVREQAQAVARAQVEVARARLQDLQRQLEFAQQVKDRRAISAEELTRRSSAVDTARAELAAAEAAVAAARAQASAVEVEIDRSVVRSPIDAEVLQVKVRAGEFAPAAPTSTPLVLLGRSKPLHVRVDVDEHEGWRGPPHGRGRRRGRRLSAGEQRQVAVQRGARLGLRLEQDGRAKRPRRSQRRLERGAQLLGAERLVLEERELPAVERLGEVRVDVDEPETDQKLRRERARGTRRASSARRAAGSRRSAAPAGCRTAARRASRRAPGPAASGAAVASRSAETTSAISAGASGTSSPASSPTRYSTTQ